MKNLPKIIVYQYVLKAERDDDGNLTWNPSQDTISKLFLGFPWQEVMNSYNKRAKFYYGFSISGHGDELFPIIDAKVEIHKASLANPEFIFEIASMPTKLTKEHRDKLYEILDNETLIEKLDFKIWWDDDPRGPRKRKLKDKKKLIEEVKNLSPYTDLDDLKMEDAEVSIHEALTHFGFETNLSAKEVKKDFKTKHRQLQLKHHPDSETGSEEAFLYLQKCHNILKKWIR